MRRWILVVLLVVACDPRQKKGPSPSPAPTADEMAAASKRRDYAAKIDKTRTGRGANSVEKVATAGPADTVLAFVLHRCGDDVLQELMRSIGRQPLRNLGFLRIGCMDLAEQHAFLSVD